MNIVSMQTRDRLSSRYDVVIVGAGPGGCITAKSLEENYKVLLLDWSRIPRDKPCGGLLVEEAQEAISKFGLPNGVFSSPKVLNLKNIDWENNIEIKTNRSLLNVYRRLFDYWLLKLSEGKVTFSSGTKFLELEEKRDRLNLLIEKNNKKEIIKSKFLIGADGSLSIVRRNIEKKQVMYYFAVQEFIKSDKNVDNNALFIYDNEITDFYSWVIPKGVHLVIGSALQKNNLEEKFNLFKTKLRDRLGIYGPISKKEVSIINKVKSKDDILLGKNNILLVGEAAGLISPSTGEGISFAIRSGLNCATAINENFDNALGKYENLCQPLIEEIEEKIEKAGILADPIRRPDFLKE